MSPDLEWRVDDPSGQQTIAKTTPPRTPRRRVWAIGLVVILGVALGVIYRSIPEPARPAPKPTSLSTQVTPTPTAMPIGLYEIVAREAQALAEGDRTALDYVVDIPNFERYQAIIGSLKPWGKPTDSALYSILDFRLTAADKAWVEVKQFNQNRYVQEIRFYHLRNGEWRRTDFDPTFWSGRTETSDTPHFRFTYYIEDYDLIEPVASLLEADYEQICADFACPTAPETCVEAFGRPWCSSFPRETLGTFNMTAPLNQDRFDLTDNGDVVVSMPSLRLLIELTPAEQEYYFRNPLAWLHVRRLAYGSIDFQEPRPPGSAFVIAIFYREYPRLLKRTNSTPPEMPAEYTQLNTESLPALEQVWNETDDAQAAQSYAVADSVVSYIEGKYGWQAVARLLTAIGPSKSLAEALKTGLGLSYVEFEKHWKAMAKLNPPTAP